MSMPRVCVCVCVCLALSKFHFANKAPKWASEFAPLKSAHKSQQQDEQGPAPAPVPGLGLGLDHISECVCQLFMSVCVCVVDVLVLLRCCLPAFIRSADCDIVTTITSGSDAHINAHTPPRHTHTETCYRLCVHMASILALCMANAPLKLRTN